MIVESLLFIRPTVVTLALFPTVSCTVDSEFSDADSQVQLQSNGLTREYRRTAAKRTQQAQPLISAPFEPTAVPPICTKLPETSYDLTFVVIPRNTKVPSSDRLKKRRSKLLSFPPLLSFLSSHSPLPLYLTIDSSTNHN